MNIDITAYKSNHTEFCENFLNNKNLPMSSPKIDSMIFSKEDDSKSIEMEKTRKSISPLKRNSKLVLYKNRLINALRNKRTMTENNTKIKSFQTQNYCNSLKMPPILFNNLKMFVNKIKRIGYLDDLSLIKSYDLNLINDQAFFETDQHDQNHEKTEIYLVLFKCLANFFSPMLRFINFYKDFGVFHPYSTIKLFWDSIISLMIIFLLFYIPLTMPFELNIIGDELKAGISIILMLDMILEMNTLCFINGFEVRSREKIIKHYLKTYFFPDMISISSIFIQILSEDDVVRNYKKKFGFLFFLKIFSLVKFSKKITNRFQFNHEWKGIKNLIILFLMIIFIAHLSACGWCYMGISEPSDKESWIRSKGILNENWITQYMYSFYWSIVTVMTVGYGDIAPTNNNEVLYCLLIILFGGMIFPYSINSVGSIIQDIQRDRKKFE